MINKRTLNARKQTLRARQTEDATLQYTVNWAPEIDTDTIFSHSWTAEDSGVTISSQTVSGQTCSCKITGDPGRYRIVHKMTTAGTGETMERYIDLIIMDNTRYYYEYDYHHGYC